MIEINLIPDVKQELIRAQRMRNLTITLSIFSGIVAGGVVVVLFLLLGAQTLHETISRDNVKKNFEELSSIENIDNVLTIQNQLSKIAAINETKTMDSRLFDVLNAINPSAPNDVKISNVRLNPSENTLIIEGSASNGYSATETFQKTILNTKLETGSGDAAETTPLTDEVVITETKYGESSDGTKVLRFIISFVYPDGLFDNTVKSLRIVTPDNRVDVTDSRTRVPESLFSQKPVTTEEGGN